MVQTLSPNIVMPVRRPDRPLVVIAGRRADTRSVFRATLETWDYDVAEVGDLIDSVIVAALERPAAVLVDGFLPMAHCLAEVEKVRRDGNMAGVPLIVISGFSKERVGEGGKSSAAEATNARRPDFDALERLLRYFSEVGGSQY
jgi:CheY-like chemotaxis protein